MSNVTVLARRSDRATSKSAGRLAETDQKVIEAWVLTQFHNAAANGLTDLELTGLYEAAMRRRGQRPNDRDRETPRKRRSGLTRKRLILADNTGRTRMGRAREQTVWVHRDYMKPKGSTA